MDKKNEVLVRVYLLLAFFALVALVMICRVIKISQFEGDKWRGKADNNIQWVEVESERGNIFDSRGNILATSLPFFDIRMDLLASKDEVFDAGIDSLCLMLAQDFPDLGSAASWKTRLARDRKLGREQKKRGVRYTKIVDNITLDQLAKLKAYPILRRGKYKGGLIVSRKNKRFKPFGELASRTIGKDRVNADKVGLEEAYDKVLSGPVSNVLMKKVSGGVKVPLFDPSELKVEKGNDLVTTLDMIMQDLVHKELSRAVLDHSASAGTAILMDTRSGAIKAISNLENSKDGLHEVRNYAVARLSEPGSTFKLASYLAMMEDADLQLNESVNLNGGKKKFYNLTMRDSHLHGEFNVSAAEAFKMSSNVGVASLAMNVYPNYEAQQNFIERLESFGLTSKTGTEIKGEAEPKVKSPRASGVHWNGTTLPWMAHGYEAMFTPLQILNFCNAIANGGDLMKPYLVDKILKNGEVWETFGSEILVKQIAKTENIRKMQALLKATVLDGTGKSVRSNLVDIAGKTGTTRVNYVDKDAKKQYNASFVGYFPAENPKYTLLVQVYNPGGDHYYGGKVAGPVFKNIAEGVMLIDDQLMHRLEDEDKGELVTSYHAGFADDYDVVLDYLGLKAAVPSRNRWVDITPKENELTVERKKILKNKIPDVIGMGLRDAVYVMENLGVKYKVYGVGRVWRQTVKPGEDIEGKTQIVYLK